MKNDIMEVKMKWPYHLFDFKVFRSSAFESAYKAEIKSK